MRNLTDNPNIWEETRSGAFSVRGFHFQHLFTVLVLIRQWAGMSKLGRVVPEGFEDCVIESADHDVWIQIRSKSKGTFSKREVNAELEKVRQKAVRHRSVKPMQIVLALEQEIDGIPTNTVDDLFNDEIEKVVRCSSPEKETISILSKRLNAPQFISESILSDLYKLVAESAALNSQTPFKKRRTISTTDIENLIRQILENTDSSFIDHALRSEVLIPLDFATAVPESGFYKGVKVQPGHVTAELVIDRPDDTDKIQHLLNTQRILLVTGPSGSGKSALVWLAAYSMIGKVRMFQTSGFAKSNDSESIVRFVRSRKPQKQSPIMLVFDEIGEKNSGLWDILAHELSRMPNVYLIGSIRSEDTSLVYDHSNVGFFRVKLDECLAKRIWTRLSQRNETDWHHWREPFERSSGLMLEYVHILTQGKQLATVIKDQVRQRERENRNEELAILRSTAVLCSRGGEVKTKALLRMLGISTDTAKAALERLIEEHLVIERSPGILGGLHVLRSKALCVATHDEICYQESETLWTYIVAATNETLPSVIQSELVESNGQNLDETLEQLSKILASNNDIKLWTSVLTGLALGTLDRSVSLFIEILNKHGVNRDSWNMASMLVDPIIDLKPDLFESSEQWRYVIDAVRAFRIHPKQDLRLQCISHLPHGTRLPKCSDIKETNQLLSCLVPIAGGDPVWLDLEPNISIEGDPNIRDTSTLLSTAILIGNGFAEKFVNSLGGENQLFDFFVDQTPWVTTPTVENGEHKERIVRCSWCLISDLNQPDPENTARQICETLIAISPNSDKAVCDVVNVLGQQIEHGGYTLFSKSILRKYLPARTRVTWNVTFRQILLLKASTHTLTEYAHLMTSYVKRAGDFFRRFTENWIVGKRISSGDVEIALGVLDEVKSITYVEETRLASLINEPIQDLVKTDTNSDLLVQVLGNLVGRVDRIPPKQDASAAAAFAYSLSQMANDCMTSEIWRATSKPPLTHLSSLAQRLRDVASILESISHDETKTEDRALWKRRKKSLPGKAIHSVANRCRSKSKARLQHRLKTLQARLFDEGLIVRFATRLPGNTADDLSSKIEIAIIVDISNIDLQNNEPGIRFIERCQLMGTEFLVPDWNYRIVAEIKDRVICDLAFIPSSDGAIPDPGFKNSWRQFIDSPFFVSEVTNAFLNAVNACNQVSSIIKCCQISNLHKEEEEVLQRSIKDFQTEYETVASFANETDSVDFVWATDFLEKTRERVALEIEITHNGRVVEEFFCDIMAVSSSEESHQLLGASILLRQTECLLSFQI